MTPIPQSPETSHGENDLHCVALRTVCIEIMRVYDGVRVKRTIM